jgi:hypothetical protein
MGKYIVKLNNMSSFYRTIESPKYVVLYTIHLRFIEETLTRFHFHHYENSITLRVLDI